MNHLNVRRLEFQIYRKDSSTSVSGILKHAMMISAIERILSIPLTPEAQELELRNWNSSSLSSYHFVSSTLPPRIVFYFFSFLNNRTFHSFQFSAHSSFLPHFTNHGPSFSLQFLLPTSLKFSTSHSSLSASLSPSLSFSLSLSQDFNEFG